MAATVAEGRGGIFVVKPIILPEANNTADAGRAQESAGCRAAELLLSSAGADEFEEVCKSALPFELSEQLVTSDG